MADNTGYLEPGRTLSARVQQVPRQNRANLGWAFFTRWPGALRRLWAAIPSGIIFIWTGKGADWLLDGYSMMGIAFLCLAKNHRCRNAARQAGSSRATPSGHHIGTGAVQVPSLVPSSCTPHHPWFGRASPPFALAGRVPLAHARRSWHGSSTVTGHSYRTTCPYQEAVFWSVVGTGMGICHTRSTSLSAHSPACQRGT